MPQQIILPMAALAFWTMFVLALIPILRVRAARAGRVEVEDFRYSESANVHGDVSLPNRDYMSLLELPVLFYAACLVQLALGRIDATLIELAWAFVAARIVHSVIHLTYNNVLHRLIAFSAGTSILLAMWTRHIWWIAQAT